jgi:hypothetical protein
MLSKTGYIYIVKNGGKKWGREDRRREDRGGKKRNPELVGTTGTKAVGRIRTRG